MDNLVCVGQSAYLNTERNTIVWCGNYVGHHDVIYGKYTEVDEDTIVNSETHLPELPEDKSYSLGTWVSEDTYRVSVFDTETLKVVDQLTYKVPTE